MDELHRALNSLLPRDVRVLRIARRARRVRCSPGRAIEALPLRARHGSGAIAAAPPVHRPSARILGPRRRIPGRGAVRRPPGFRLPRIVGRLGEDHDPHRHPIGGPRSRRRDVVLRGRGRRFPAQDGPKPGGGARGGGPREPGASRIWPRALAAADRRVWPAPGDGPRAHAGARGLRARRVRRG